MLKIVITLFLSIFSLTLKAQTERKTTFLTKLYGDIEFGVISYKSPDGLSPGTSSISAGYRFNKEYSAGIVLRALVEPNYCCAIGATGLGIQLRTTPTTSPIILKLETGLILKAEYGDDASSYYNVYNREKSSKIYYSVSAAGRFLKIMTLGLCWASTDRQKFDNFDNKTNEYRSTSTISVTGLSLVLGITIPKYRK